MGDYIEGGLRCVANRPTKWEKECHSSDAMALYVDETDKGHKVYSAFCWSCEQAFSNNRLVGTEIGEQIGIVRYEGKESTVGEINNLIKKEKREPVTKDQIRELRGYTDETHEMYRGVEDEYHNFYGIRSEYDEDGKMYARHYPITEDFKPSAYKQRVMPKDFTQGYLGRNSINCDLFGLSRFKNGNKWLLIVGGEEDCPAAYKMLKEDQIRRQQSHLPPVAVVSPTVGETSAYKQIQNNYDKLEKFDIIVVCMDDDDAGNKAAEKVLSKLPPGKIRQMVCPSKDPCQALKEGKQREFVNAFYNAKEYLAQGVTGSGEISDKMREEMAIERLPLPPFMSTLEKMMAGGVPLGRIFTLSGLSGGGKCLGKGTPILMHDGSIKPVEAVAVGDVVMGDDGSPRNILSTTTGREMLYKVKQVKGMDYVVNESHILSLRCGTNYGKYKKGEVVNLSVKDYLNSGKSFKRFFKGYKGDCVNLDNGIDVWEPYILGLWLADGTTDKPQITFNKEDKELIQEYEDFIVRNGYRRNVSPSNDRQTVLSIDAAGGFRTKLNELGVLGNKHIPSEYKSSSYGHRVELLSGILDGDGHLHNNCYEIVLKDNALAEDVVFLARSLGFYVNVTDKFSKCQNFEGAYYKRIFISGDTDKLYLVLSRKKATPRKQVKDVLHTGVELEKLGEGDYYGFEVDGNHLFQLGDGTVTHNSTFVNEMIYFWLFNSPHKIGVLSLELDEGEYGVAMLSRHIGKKINLIPTVEERLEYLQSPEVIAKEKELLFNEDGSHRWMMLDEGDGTIGDVQERILNMIVQHECKVIVLDPLSDLFDGLTTDEQAMHMRWQKRIVKKYKVIFVDILHVRKGSDKGKSGTQGKQMTEEDIHGSSSIFKSGAANVLFSRNKYEEDPIEMNTSYVYMPKCRWTGKTGNAGRWYYDLDTHTVHDRDMFFGTDVMEIEEEKPVIEEMKYIIPEGEDDD